MAIFILFQGFQFSEEKNYRMKKIILVDFYQNIYQTHIISLDISTFDTFDHGFEFELHNSSVNDIAQENKIECTKYSMRKSKKIITY